MSRSHDPAVGRGIRHHRRRRRRLRRRLRPGQGRQDRHPAARARARRRPASPRRRAPACAARSAPRSSAPGWRCTRSPRSASCSSDPEVRPDWHAVGSLRIARDRRARRGVPAARARVATQAGLEADADRRGEAAAPLAAAWTSAHAKAVLWCPTDGYMTPASVAKSYEHQCRQTGRALRDSTARRGGSSSRTAASTACETNRGPVALPLRHQRRRRARLPRRAARRARAADRAGAARVLRHRAARRACTPACRASAFPN